MMKRLNVVLIFVSFAACSFAQPSWTIDKAHTGINFSVTHLVISEVQGKFEDFSGSVVSSKDDFTDAQINFVIDAESINTENEKRDDHLEGEDFFNAEKYPKITFKSTSLNKVSGKKYELTGDLTIRDVTKRVKFDVTYNGTIKDPWGNTRAGFKATTVINRFDYNLKWNSMADVGPIVGSDVTITINTELVKK